MSKKPNKHKRVLKELIDWLESRESLLQEMEKRAASSTKVLDLRPQKVLNKIKELKTGGEMNDLGSDSLQANDVKEMLNKTSGQMNVYVKCIQCSKDLPKYSLTPVFCQNCFDKLNP
jgi:hypothetical protein